MQRHSRFGLQQIQKLANAQIFLHFHALGFTQGASAVFLGKAIHAL